MMERQCLEGKPGLTDCGLPLLNAVRLPSQWRAGHQAEQGEEADGGEDGHPADEEVEAQLVVTVSHWCSPVFAWRQLRIY